MFVGDERERNAEGGTGAFIVSREIERPGETMLGLVRFKGRTEMMAIFWEAPSPRVAEIQE